jgi:DNA-directed RNA polymerase subunit RPC12/RpoP
MPSLNQIHRQERQKPAAVLIDGELMCGDCSGELWARSIDLLNAIDIERRRGRGVVCDQCGERLLDTAGQPRYRIDPEEIVTLTR